MLEENSEDSKKGYLIIFEGIEGVGKSTQAELLFNSLQKEVHNEVILTKEPSTTDIGLKIRDIIFNESTFTMTELFLFLADRSQHIREVINPALREGKTVICDRFSLSTLCYQGVLVSISKLDLLKLDKEARSELISPRKFLQFVLTLPVDTAFNRISQRKKDVIEERDKSYFESVNEQFKLNHDLLYFDEAESHLINADLDSESIHQEIKSVII